MTLEATNPRIYTDFSGLANLKASARSESPEATRIAAKEFEASFIQMMLKSLRDTTDGEGIMDSESSRMYQDMFDKQISIDISARGDFGIAKLIEEQLSKQQPAPVEAADKAVPVEQNLFSQTGQINSSTLNIRTRARATNRPIIDLNKSGHAIIGGFANLGSMAQPMAKLSSKHSVQTETFKSPEEFIKTMRSHAKNAAREIGVNPDLLIAQAALETGWGSKVIKNSDGSSSHNLFGIKASHGWDGDKVRIGSLEYSHGVAKKEVSDFRSYSSFADSFKDYVSFIKDQSRYENAVKQAANSESYIKNLQQAGYATDPNYATKILNIMERDDLQTAWEG